MARSKSAGTQAKESVLSDWRDEMLGRVRALIAEADADAVETRKWRGVPVWEHDGIICTGETYRDKVKLTFAHGASLKDPSGLFNSSLEGNMRRAIDIHEGEKLNERALKTLIRTAIEYNLGKSRKKVSARAKVHRSRKA